MPDEAVAAEGRGFSSEAAVAVIVGLVALGMYLWELSVPEQFSLYDSGVYIASAVHLVSGALPYRDFTFVQPPGILYLLAPIGALSRIVGTHDGLIVGQALTGAVAALNCSLVAWLVRRHGSVAMLAAGVALAVCPLASQETASVKLEPYCLALILLAAVVVFRSDSAANLSTRRSILAGFLLGFAGLVKLWAVGPFIALVIIVAWRSGRRVLWLVGAASSTFLLGVLPFLAAAPGSFIREVFVEQLGRRANSSDSAVLLWRLRDLTGYTISSIKPGSTATVVAFAALVVVVGLAYRRAVTDAEIFILASTALVVTMLLASTETYSYYGYFAQPFLVALATVSVARVVSPVARRLSQIRLSTVVRHLVRAAGVTIAALAVVGVVLYSTSFYSTNAYVYGYYGPWMNAVTRTIPEGACVVYNQVAFGVYANRLSSSSPGCPDVVDLVGEWMAHGYQTVAPSRKFSDQWLGYFTEARYVVLTPSPFDQPPWTPHLRHWFKVNFRVVKVFHYGKIYEARST